MPDEPINPAVPLSAEEAERILAAWLGERRRVLGLRRLTGGCVHTVIEAAFEGEGSPVVLKIAPRPGEESIRTEHEVLGYFRAHTAFPAPRPLACDVSGEAVPYSWLSMERLEGVHLGEAEARMLAGDRSAVQRQMAEAVAGLHKHTRKEGFGHLLVDRPRESWPDYFTETLTSNYEDACATGLLGKEATGACARIVEAAPLALRRTVKPTLVHGDIWATNIMVAGEPGRMRLSGFLDPGGLFADPEYELAYLEIWHTAGPAFLDAYQARHPAAEGYELRRLFYWLNTLLLHVWCFRQEHYADGARGVIRELSRSL